MIPPRATQPLAGRSVFVVDDHVDSAELLEMLLVSNGATVAIAHSGASALAHLAAARPDILLLDITLPDMNGYELLAEIRNISGLEKTPAVAVTGHAYERDREKAANVGFAVHTVKPIDVEALVHLIGKLTTRAASESSMLDEVRALLADKGISEVLGFLNARTSHRYTAHYKYEGPILRNIALYDRLNPSSTKGDDAPVETTFCGLVERDRGTFVTRDGSIDPRAAGLPLRDNVKAYCGVLIRNADGTPFGSLCHFDHVPRDVPDGEVALLEELGPLLASSAAADVF